MTFASKLLPTSPSDRRITLCVMFVVVVNFMIGWLRAIVLFSDVRVNVVFDFIEMFSLTLIGLSFCLHPKLKVKLIALSCTVGLYLITSIVCIGKIDAKIWRFQNPERYSLALLDEVTVKNKTIKLYLVRDQNQKFDWLMLTRVGQICKGIELYWPIKILVHTSEGKLHLNQDSMIVTDGKGQTQVVPMSAIP